MLDVVAVVVSSPHQSPRQCLTSKSMEETKPKEDIEEGDGRLGGTEKTRFAYPDGGCWR